MTPSYYRFHTALIARLPHSHANYLTIALSAVFAVLILALAFELAVAKQRSVAGATVLSMAAHRRSPEALSRQVA